MQQKSVGFSIIGKFLIRNFVHSNASRCKKNNQTNELNPQKAF
jgi:hypothetical protein